MKTKLLIVFVLSTSAIVIHANNLDSTELDLITIEDFTNDPEANDLTDVASTQMQSQLIQNDFCSFEASYVSDNAFNFCGGLERGFVHMGMIDLAATISTSGAGLWNGGQFYLQIETTYGGTPSADLTGDLQVFSNIENGNYTYLYQMLYSQRLKDLIVTLGVHDLNSEFLASEFASVFINSSFGIMPSVSMNVPVSIFPKPVLGGVIKYAPSNYFSIQTALYDGEPLDLDLEPYNASFKPNEENSFFSIVEIAMGLGKDEKYQGTIKMGAYYHSGDFIDMTNQEISIIGNYGTYAIVDQLFSGNNKNRKIGTFAKVGITNKDRNEFPVFWGMGINYFSPFRERTNDLFGLAISNMGINKAHVGSDLNYHYGNETVIECLYMVSVNDNIMFQPEIQFIIHPGAQASINNAVVAVFRAGISF